MDKLRHWIDLFQVMLRAQFKVVEIEFSWQPQGRCPDRSLEYDCVDKVLGVHSTTREISNFDFGFVINRDA